MGCHSSESSSHEEKYKHSKHKRCHKHKHCHKCHMNTVQVSNLSPFPCPPTSNDPNGSGAVFLNSEATPNIAVGYNPINEDKPMVVVCYQQDCYNLSGGCSANYMKISLDGGHTFGNAIALPNVICYGGQYERTSYPHVAITSNGDILFAGLPFNIIANFQTDITIAKYDVKTQTFTYVKNIDPQVGNFTGPNDTGSDYPTLVVDPQDCTGNTAYMGWTRYWALDYATNFTHYQSNIGFSKTTDGTNWSPVINYAQTPALDISLGYDLSVSLSDTNIGLNQFVLLDNPDKPYSKIIALFEDYTGFNYGAINQYNLLYSCYSLDQGITWSKPLLIDIRFNGGSGQTATQIVDPDDHTILIRGGDGNPNGATDRKRNRIFAVAGLDSLLNLPNPAPAGLYLFVSLDSAQTWKTIGKINRDQSVQAFNAAITILKNGDIAISYYDFRNHLPNVDTTLSLETDRWMDIFHYNECDNTVQLVKEIRMTKTSFNFRNAIPLSGPNYFIGDYMGTQSYCDKIYNSYGIANNDPNNMTDIYSSTIML